MCEVFGAQCDRKLKHVCMRSKELLASSQIPIEGVQDDGHHKRSVALQQEPTENNTHQKCTVGLYINPSFQARLHRPSHLLQQLSYQSCPSAPFWPLTWDGPNTTVSHLQPGRSGLSWDTPTSWRRNTPTTALFYTLISLSWLLLTYFY